MIKRLEPGKGHKDTVRALQPFVSLFQNEQVQSHFLSLLLATLHHRGPVIPARPPQEKTPFALGQLKDLGSRGLPYYVHKPE